MRRIGLILIVSLGLPFLVLSQNGSLPDTLQIGKHTVAEWNHIIDTTWGEGRTTEEKLQLFDYFWNKADRESVDFINNPLDWDSIRNLYRPQVEAGLSRGRFIGLMQRMCFSLGNSHNNIADTEIYNEIPENGSPILVLSRGAGEILESQGHFSAALTPLEDSTLLVFRVAENHPLNLEKGDRIIGYDDVAWKNLFPMLLEMYFPSTSFMMVPGFGPQLLYGSTPASKTHMMLKSAGLNWHLFDTIDIIKFGQSDTIHLPTSLLEGFNIPVTGNEQIAVKGIELPGSVFDGQEYINGTKPVKWGIIEGTKIGYIYVWIWQVDQAKTDFHKAINELMESEIDGLIIDYRYNVGGYLCHFLP